MQSNDVRGTPWALFDELEERFGDRDIDVCTSPHLAKCTRVLSLQGALRCESLSRQGIAAACPDPVWQFTKGGDGLTLPWDGHAFCNPPFSEVAQWLRKAWVEFTEGRALSIVMLLPTNKTDQRAWQTYVEPYRDRQGGPLRTHNLIKRRRYSDDQGIGYVQNAAGTAAGSPAFGTVVLHWRRDA